VRVDRIDYSNDTATASVKGSLQVGNAYLAATGNQSFGYFGGGSTGSKSSIERIDYTNDTATAAAKGPLSVGRSYFAATGNADFGYFGGGFPSGGSPGRVSTVDRIDYSNDTATASPKGPLTATTYRHSATGNVDFGYFFGGNPGTRSSIDRIDYSNDTADASPKGTLSSGRIFTAATSAAANALPQ